MHNPAVTDRLGELAERHLGDSAFGRELRAISQLIPEAFQGDELSLWIGMQFWL